MYEKALVFFRGIAINFVAKHGHTSPISSQYRHYASSCAKKVRLLLLHSKNTKKENHSWNVMLTFQVVQHMCRIIACFAQCARPVHARPIWWSHILECLNFVCAHLPSFPAKSYSAIAILCAFPENFLQSAWHERLNRIQEFGRPFRRESSQQIPHVFKIKVFSFLWAVRLNTKRKT